MKQAKVYTIISYHRGRENEYTGTLQELTEVFSYKLECGASWARQKGCKKVNTHPTTIKGLLAALSNAVYNTQGGCYEQDRYYLKEA